jgi:hypothetical protein
MAGTFAGVCNAQQIDMNGNPLAGCLLTVYAGGTTMLASTFQDIGLTLPTTNPLVANAAGRLPLFFVQDGTYALRLTDKNGIQSGGGFFYPQVPSIGASSSGGSVTPIDPATIFSTGMWTWKPDASPMAGWVRLSGRTIGNASSGASERANADCQPLYIYVWSTYADAICPVIGGRGASALADFSANKQITLLDGRGRSIFGLDDMGNAAKGAFTGVPFQNGNATTGGASGGEAGHALTTTELAAHSHTNTLTDPGHTHVIPYGMSGVGSTNTSAPQGGPSYLVLSVNSPSTNSSTTGVTINNASAGNGSAHNNTPLFLLGAHFWKL